MTIAFFDLDGTLVNGNSTIRFVKFLIKNNIIGFKKLILKSSLRVLWYYLSGKQAKEFRVLEKIYARELKGISTKFIEEKVEDFFKTEKRFYNQTIIERLKMHQNNGDICILISASPEHIVKKYQNEFSFNEAYYTVLEQKGGFYTGKIKGSIPFGEEKARIVRFVSKKFKFPLKDCYAYGNSGMDYAMLKEVGKAFMVHPKGRLERYSSKA
jgi:HAD superfamily hydrolase (TIGR01490 family)